MHSSIEWFITAPNTYATVSKIHHDLSATQYATRDCVAYMNSATHLVVGSYPIRFLISGYFARIAFLREAWGSSWADQIKSFSFMPRHSLRLRATFPQREPFCRL